MIDRVRLLIIDENPLVRNALATRLGTMPQLEVLGSVGSVPEAQTALAQAAPDVVLIEPKRLNGEGISLIETLVSLPRPPLIIVLTSYHDEDEELVATELGISCYMLKEIDSQALLNAILSCRDKPDYPPA
jgi:DNA-binding NarL/FixJ family response regulator